MPFVPDSPDPRVPSVRFPDPATADPDGLLAVGGDLAPHTLLAAYRQGIFPWPSPGLPLLWFSPPRRAVLFFDRLHLPRSLARARQRHSLHFTIDTAFPAVMEACAAAPRPGQDGTWITPAMRRAYGRLHELGHAHSVEAWEGPRLVAGLYGVELEGAFSAESMFHRVPNASKLTLLFLVDHLRSRGREWIDIQTLTPHMERLGAIEIPRDEFLSLLAATRGRGLPPLRKLPTGPAPR